MHHFLSWCIRAYLEDGTKDGKMEQNSLFIFIDDETIKDEIC